MKTNRTIFEPRGKTLKDITTFTSNGTWNKPSWCTGVVVYVTGGGGGAGGSNGASNGGGGGGSAGGMAIKLIDEHSLTNSTETVTVGNYGAGGLTANGATGGASSFGSHATGNGGGGGGSAAAGMPRRIGGTATGGDVNISGGDGYPGSLSGSTGSVIPLQLGASAMWGGCRAGQSIQSGANVGYWYGCGGASAVGIGTYGGNGKEGIVIIYEFEGI